MNNDDYGPYDSEAHTAIEFIRESLQDIRERLDVLEYLAGWTPPPRQEHEYKPDTLEDFLWRVDRKESA